MSELTHIFLCAVLKSLEIALQAHFSIKDTLAISECRNEKNDESKRRKPKVFIAIFIVGFEVKVFQSISRYMYIMNTESHITPGFIV